MKAIITKIIPQTETKPTRIKASAEGVKSIIYSKYGIENELINFGVRVIDENIQRHVALKFRDANNWTHVGGNPQGPIQNLATGQLPNQDWVHCFIPVEEEPRKKTPEEQERFDKAFDLGTFRSDRCGSDLGQVVTEHFYEKPRVFTVVAVSANTNKFGYKEVLVLCEDGTGYRCLYQAYGSDPVPARGDKIAEKDLPTYCRQDLPKETPAQAVKLIKYSSK